VNREYRPVADVILQRRSVRHFATDPVDGALVQDLVALACAAPAPHHSRPWRFAHVTSGDARARLADAMSESWLEDLSADDRSVVEVDRLIKRSRAQVLDAPALLVACLALDETRTWPDERRRAAERDMFVQSLGAALQNILLAAVERGLVGYLKGAPLFCGPAVKQALDLPPDWHPAFLVLLGYPEDGHEQPPRPPVDIEDHLTER
jgi:coenzyme F420-0:L-glutamate ligase/coenzyme F420-1:gamma-L-glutamate ligase